MMRIFLSALLVLAILSGTQGSASAESGFQANFGGGIDSPNQGSGRRSATVINTQLATLSKFLRFHGSFSALFGSSYLEGEGGMGIAIYPVSQFVSDRAAIHPFLQATGTVGVGQLNGES